MNKWHMWVQISVCKIVCVDCSLWACVRATPSLLLSGTTVCAGTLYVDRPFLFSAGEEEDAGDIVVDFQCYKRFRVRFDCGSVDLTGKSSFGEDGCYYTHFGPASQKEQRKTGNGNSTDSQWRAEEPIEWLTKWTATGKRQGTPIYMYGFVLITPNLILCTSSISKHTSIYTNIWTKYNINNIKGHLSVFKETFSGHLSTLLKGALCNYIKLNVCNICNDIQKYISS